VTAAVLLAASAAVVADAQTGAVSPAGKTTVEQTVAGDDRKANPFAQLSPGPGEPYTVREGGIAAAKPGREARRRSLAYFAQLTDFQLADGESPARVEFTDPRAAQGAPTSSAWRPQEEMVAHVTDQAIRQVNSFSASPVPQAGGARAQMGFAITTGDSADNQQRNETREVVTLLEGGRADPSSGSSDVSKYPPGCQALVAAGQLDPAEAPRYTGVQDYDDSRPASGGTGDGDFYDPDEPFGRFAAFPKYPGLMDRAQASFDTPGLNVPSYVTFGNHDGLVQGNQAANRAFEDIATGCIKTIATDEDPSKFALDLNLLLGNPPRNVIVPPDAGRQFIDKAQYKQLHDTGKQADAHGFKLIDPAESRASNGAAGYYAFSPAPGFRFIGLDTVSEGGVTGPSADGNIDDPQFRFIRREIEAASKRDELIVLYGHHGLTSMQDAPIPDEAAPPCTGAKDEHGHDGNPGCDVDPRASTPIHLADDLTKLLHEFPHVIAFVSGHSHVNSAIPFKREGGGGFWLLRTAAEIDWPQQNRLIDVMDNRDGTLSIFGTILDHASPVQAPPAGTSAAGFGVAELASVGRLLAYNDPQTGGGTGEGKPEDRNVELLLRDPRRASVAQAPEEEEPDTDPSADDEEDAAGGSGEGEDDSAETAPGGAGDDSGDGSLPFTGLALIPLGLLGLGLVVGGAALRARRR